LAVALCLLNHENLLLRISFGFEITALRIN
jgi:hypothetical protein